VDRLCRDIEHPRRDVPPITMTTVWAAGLGGFLMLCVGVLLGSTWTVQILKRQHERLAAEWRRLNATRLALQQTSRRCSRCGNPIVSAASHS
jgi:hypothetical protein